MKNLPSRIIGLTGGIGTGKTAVSNYLARQYKLPVLDADIYAREAVTQKSPILQALYARYGNRIKLPDGNLNRPALGDIIFSNVKEKQWLESQIHPYIRDRFEQELQQIQNDTIVLAIPLLFEANLTDMVTEIWVIKCDRILQIARLQQRNSLTLEQAQARIDNQIPLSEKVALADIVLDNNSDLNNLFQQVDTAISQSTT